MSKSIAIRIDDELKEQAETMLDEIGLNMTTYVISSLKALVREQKVPFELTARSRWSDPESLAALEECIQMKNNPSTKKFKNMEELIADLEDDSDE
jgi:DNA-damage-inducible protein J